MQVIEKVKVVPEGYNGAGMDGYNRRDVNGKANAGLTLGIIGTALGAWALFGNNRRSTGLLGAAGGSGMLGDGSTNINVVGAGIGAGTAAPSAFQAWAKSCEDTLALQGGLYQWALTQQNQRFQDRQLIDSEMFGLYKSQIDADFELYKGQRDNYDALKAEIDSLKCQVAVNSAVRPYQDKLIQCEIEKAFTAGINYVDRKTCNVIYGVTVLPNEPTTLMHSIMIIANCLRNGLVVTLMKRLLLVLLTFGSKMMILMATRYGSTSTRCNPYYN